jgi:hypothetical protein
MNASEAQMNSSSIYIRTSERERKKGNLIFFHTIKHERERQQAV